MNIKLFKTKKGLINIHLHHHWKITPDGNFLFYPLALVICKEGLSIIVLNFWLGIGWNE